MVMLSILQHNPQYVQEKEMYSVLIKDLHLKQQMNYVFQEPIKIVVSIAQQDVKQLKNHINAKLMEQIHVLEDIGNAIAQQIISNAQLIINVFQKIKKIKNAHHLLLENAQLNSKLCALMDLAEKLKMLAHHNQVALQD